RVRLGPRRRHRRHQPGAAVQPGDPAERADDAGGTLHAQAGAVAHAVGAAVTGTLPAGAARLGDDVSPARRAARTGRGRRRRPPASTSTDGSAGAAPSPPSTGGRPPTAAGPRSAPPARATASAAGPPRRA